MRTLVIQELSQSLKDKDILNIFGRFGRIMSVEIPKTDLRVLNKYQENLRKQDAEKDKDPRNIYGYEYYKSILEKDNLDPEKILNNLEKRDRPKDDAETENPLGISKLRKDIDKNNTNDDSDYLNEVLPSFTKEGGTAAEFDSEITNAASQYELQQAKLLGELQNLDKESKTLFNFSDNIFSLRATLDKDALYNPMGYEKAENEEYYGETQLNNEGSVTLNEEQFEALQKLKKFVSTNSLPHIENPILVELKESLDAESLPAKDPMLRLMKLNKETLAQTLDAILANVKKSILNLEADIGRKYKEIGSVGNVVTEQVQSHEDLDSNVICKYYRF